MFQDIKIICVEITLFVYCNQIKLHFKGFKSEKFCVTFFEEEYRHINHWLMIYMNLIFSTASQSILLLL